MRMFAGPKELLELRRTRLRIYSTSRAFRHGKMRRHGFFLFNNTKY
jgi:hypothetical protein